MKSFADTAEYLIGTDILHQSPSLFQRLFQNQTAIIIADTNTYEAAGKQVEEIFKQAGIPQEKPFIFDDPNLYAEWKYVCQLEERLSKTEAIPIAVGSGVINDLCKLVAHRCSRKYLCIGTAASMDGYTAYGSSITFEGSKQAFDCPAPYGMLIDSRIAAAAPTALSASGYADLIAKIPAGADWILADALNIEAILEPAFDIVQSELKDALSQPQAIREGNIEATEKLEKGLIYSGFGMQLQHSSRPASGTEHQFSHLWDMEHHTHMGETVSHGFKVGIGTLATSAFYELLLASPVDTLDVEQCVREWKSWEETEADIRTLFKGQTEFIQRCVPETKAKYIDKEQLRIELNTLKAQWPSLSEKLRKQTLPVQQIRENLKMVGSAFEPEQIGISRAKLKESCLKVQYMRSRYAIIDLAQRTGYLSTWLEQLFGKDGIWEIK